MTKNFYYLAIVLIAMCISQKGWAQQAYAALSEDYRTLTFYYDNNKTERNGRALGPFLNVNCTKEWNDHKHMVTTVVFDKSFDAYHDLSSTAFWFSNFLSLTEIRGIENLHTEKVGDMTSMFARCFALKSVDISGFEHFGKTVAMFHSCYSLSTIYADEYCRLYGDQIFANCFNLEGGQGTEYSADKVNGDYAHVDGLNGPGYFTLKGTTATIPPRNQAYAAFDADGHTLTFYYDKNKKVRDGMGFGSLIDYGSYENIQPWTVSKPWDPNYRGDSIVAIVFDTSFSEYAGVTSTNAFFLRPL